MIRLPCSQLLKGEDGRQAVALARTGDAEGALAALEGALNDARESSDLVRVGGVLGAMGLLLEHLNRGSEARVRLQAAISLFRSRAATIPEAAYMGVLAEIRAHHGEVDAARRALELGEAVLRDEESWTELGSLLVRRAMVEMLADDPVLACAALSDARAVCATEQVYAEVDQAVATLHVTRELAEVA